MQTRTLLLLRYRKQPGALRYRLKNALFRMGSSGYPFEHFIGELFRQMGFAVQVGVVVEGNPKRRFSTSYSAEYVLLETSVNIFVKVRIFHIPNGIFIRIFSQIFIHAQKRNH